MKKSVKDAIDRILELRSEFSDADLIEAATILSKSENKLFFKGQKQDVPEMRGARQRSKKTRREPKLSKIVSDLREKDTEKFEMLCIFEEAFRQGQVLRSLEMIRVTGASIDKSFDPGKSRKGAISKFMKLLASLPTTEARNQIDRILEDERSSYDSDKAYSRLAEFIMGKLQ
jgi:hypothetical protein